MSLMIGDVLDALLTRAATGEGNDRDGKHKAQAHAQTSVMSTAIDNCFSKQINDG
jgi:hypothetical protein